MPYKDPQDPRIIAYRKAYYERTKNDPRRKEWNKTGVKNYRAKNKLKINKYLRENLCKEKIKLKRHRYKDKYNKNYRDKTKNLEEVYIIRQLKKENWTTEAIRANPEIISAKRILIKIKRHLNKSK